MQTARKFFPLFHWLATLVLGPLIDGLISADSRIVHSIDIYFTVLIASSIQGLPALVIYWIIYRALHPLFKTRWEFKLFMVIVAGILMLATLTMYDTGFQQDHSLAYGLAIWLSSLFLPAGPYKKRSKQERRDDH